MKFYLRTLIVFVIFILFLCVFALSDYDKTTPLFEDDGYEIQNYNVNMVVNEDNSIDIQEEITAYFIESSRGLVRYLPLSSEVTTIKNGEKDESKKYDYSYTNLKIEESEDINLIKKEERSNYLVLYIGDIYPKSNFSQTYQISYTIHLGDDRDSTKDYFYFNVLGSGWNTEVQSFNFSITFPKKVDLTGQKYYAYYGAYGEDSEGEELVFSGNTISGNYLNIEYGTAITIYTEFKNGYFNVPYNYIFDILIMLFIVIIFTILIVFYLKNKTKNKIVEVVEFSAPKDITPTQAGFLIDGVVQNKDITALLVYWASKGILKISENDGNIELKKIKELPDNAKSHEKTFFQSIFFNKECLSLKELNYNIAVAGNSCKNQVESRYKQFFTDNIDKVLKIWSIIVIVMFASFYLIALRENNLKFALFRILFGMFSFLSILPLYWAVKKANMWTKTKKFFMCILAIILFVGGFAGTNFFFLYKPYDPFYTRFILATMLVFSIIVLCNVEKVTKEGAILIGALLGLKKYILLAEKQKMERQVKDSPELFYQILPYAYVLGVSDVYMEKFADVSAMLNMYDYLGIDFARIIWISAMLNNRLTAIGVATRWANWSYAVGKLIKHSSSGGGFSGGKGGGFSGGGHGGGGGGRF